MKLRNVFITVLFVASFASVARAEVTQDEIGPICLKSIGDQAESVKLDKVVAVKTSGAKKEILLLRGPYSAYNGTVLVLLREPTKCDLVLDTEARGVQFKYIKGKTFPNIYTYMTSGKDADGIMITEDIIYVWDGKKYKEKMK